MKRNEVENKTFAELRLIINKKYGLTRGNDLVNREAFRIVCKSLSPEIIETVNEEAAKRVLSGHDERQEILLNEMDLTT